METLCLRIKDMDFEKNTIAVRDASTSPPSGTHYAILRGSASLAFGQIRQLTCSCTATISARFKSYWDMVI
jgi:hypothetical protein